MVDDATTGGPSTQIEVSGLWKSRSDERDFLTVTKRECRSAPAVVPEPRLQGTRIMLQHQKIQRHVFGRGGRPGRQYFQTHDNKKEPTHGDDHSDLCARLRNPEMRHQPTDDRVHQTQQRLSLFLVIAADETTRGRLAGFSNQKVARPWFELGSLVEPPVGLD